MHEILSEEINVKEIIFTLGEQGKASYVLDTELTSELKEEGIVRDIVRKIQGWRKEQNLQITDRASYVLTATEEEKAAVEKNRTKIMELTGLNALHIE